MNFDLPRDQIVAVDEIDVRLDPGIHPFVARHRAEIEANWQVEVEANPALFNGDITLLASLSWRDRVLSGVCHIVSFATFLYWRKTRPYPSAEHAYAHAVLVTKDNALLAIRMGPHTVSAGLVYFASGSFDSRDFADGRVDLPANMVREVREETGLDIANARTDKGYHALSLPNGTAVFRRYYLDDTADVLAARIVDYVRSGDDPEGEITGPVIIRDAAELPEPLAAQMPAIIAWHFSGN